MDNLTYQEIKIISKKEEPTGISIDLFTFGKEDFYKFIDKNVDLKNNRYAKIFINVKDIHRINETKNFFENKGATIKEIKGTQIEIDYIDPGKPVFEPNIPIELLNSFIKELANIKLMFKTDLDVKDILELKEFNDLYDKLLECHFILKGITINFKLFLLNVLDMEISKNQNNNNLTEILFLLKIILSLKDSYLPDPKGIFNDLKTEVNKLFEKSQLEEFVQSTKIGIKEFLKNLKSIQSIENIKLEEITIVLPMIDLEIGLFLKLKSKTFEQYIKEKKLKRKNKKILIFEKN